VWLVVLALTACKDKVEPVDSGQDTDLPLTLITPPVGEPALVFEGARPRNILMISMDTTRRDHIGPYSTWGSLTPFLTELINTGVSLEDHQQCSNWTYASTSCTLMGRYHEENGFIPELTALGKAPFPDGMQTLALRLGEVGYHSMLISTNAWLGNAWNNGQGYTEVPSVPGGPTAHLFSEAVPRLEAAIAGGADPWMLHVHLMEPHPPYVPPAAYMDEANALPPIPWDISKQQAQYATTALWPEMTPEEQDLLEAHLRARYRGEIRYVDDQLRAVFDDLDARGLLDDTLVVFWTDHGEQFWEHDQQAHAFYLGAEENDGVLLFWAKNLRPARWPYPTHAVDLLPTVMEAVGHPAEPGDLTLNGYVLGTAPPTRPRFGMSVARLGVLQSVTLDGWKLTFNFAGTLRLFDRNTDREELVDLYEPDPDNEHVLPLWNLLVPRIHRMHELNPSKPLVWPEGLPQ
jgi:arylsulfatase A-like enzyme